MDYFVNFENHPEYHWQIELLVESFKYNRLDKNLLLVVAEHNFPPNPNHCRNLLLHKRIVGYRNIGHIRGHLPLNQLYGIMWANLSKNISQPFAVIPSDCVLRHPLKVEIKDYPQFTFYPDHSFNFESVTSHIGSFWEWINIPKETFETNWIPLGSIFVFSKIPIEFFQVVIDRAEFLAIKQVLEGKEIWEHTAKLALVTVLIEYLQKISCTGDYSFISSVLNSTDSSFISYEDGMKPDFHKSMFKH